MPTAYVIGTCDTKGQELGYLKQLLEAAEAVCAAADRSSSTTTRTPAAVARRRQEAREKWARIARQNETAG